MPAGRTRRRTCSALAPAGFAFPRIARSPALPALLLALLALPAPVPAHAQTPAAEPAAGQPPARSHTRAYVAMGTGLALTGLSFVLAEQADQAYEDYLAETDPSRVEDAYQKTLRNDRLAAAALIAGQAALVLGIYWRFLHHPDDDPEANQAPRWGVRPNFDEDGGAGLALDVRF